jgi:hypothetical protein
MFQALLAEVKEALHKQHSVYCMPIMSAVCYQGWSGTLTLVATSQHTTVVNAVPPEDEQVVLETCRGC